MAAAPAMRSTARRTASPLFSSRAGARRTAPDSRRLASQVRTAARQSFMGEVPTFQPLEA